MRDRLIELLENCPAFCGGTMREMLAEKSIEAIADHLLADGVIVPPCQVGDRVFEIEKDCLKCPNYKDFSYSDFCECMLDDNKQMFEVDFDKDCNYEIVETKFEYSMLDKIGKTVFLTREEAERALQEEGK